MKDSELSQHFLKRHFIQSLLEDCREITEEEAESRKKSLGVDELMLPCVVACVAPSYVGIAHENRDRWINDYEKYIFRFLKKHGFVFCTNIGLGDNIQIVLHTNATDKLDELFIRLHEKMQLKFGIELFIGIGSKVDKYGNISVSATEATEMLAYKYQYADRGVSNISNIVRLRHNISYGSNEKYDRVLGCFKDGDLGKMDIRLNELISEIRYRQHVSGTSIKRTIIELTVNILHIASNANVDVDAILMGDDPYRWIMQQNETPAITAWFLQLASRLLDEMVEQKLQRQKSIISDACNYIEANIGDNRLGLQSVSERVGLSVPYFSQLFKNEKNIGLNNYIAFRRVEHAKVLLRDTNLKNEDISRQLGFSRQNYFISVFKKQEGVSPGEFRKRERAKKEKDKP